MFDLIYIAGFIFTFLYSAWRSAARDQLHDPLEWVVIAIFSMSWPLVWIVVLVVHSWLNSGHRKAK